MKVSTQCFVLLVLVVLVGVQSQFTDRRVTGNGAVGDCQVPDANGINSLISGSLSATVTVSDFTIVCQSPGLVRGTISSFSVIVSFSCTSGPAECDGSLLTNQFQFDCNSDNTFTMAEVGRGDVRTTSPTGNLMTPLNESCGECVDPPEMTSDDHCAACNNTVCNEGQQGCVGVSMNTQSCCNWYVEERCVVSCPGNLIGDAEPGTMYDCGCGPLQLEFGDINFTNRFAGGSIANHTCDPGYVFSDNSSDGLRVCNMTTEEWTGETITCNRTTTTTTTTTTTITNTTGNGTENNNLRAIIIGVSVGGCVLILILLIIVIFAAVWWKKKNKSSDSKVDLPLK